jgi:hypothetical protein
MQHKLIEIPQSDLVGATEIAGHKNRLLILLNNLLVKLKNIGRG